MKPKAATNAQNDGAIDALIAQLRQTDANSGQCLWLADEHPLPSNLFAALSKRDGIFLSNRFDQHQLAEQHGLKSYFSDFNLSEIEPTNISSLFFRTAKERPVVHRVINQAKHLLSEGDTFWLAGYKNEGIKTHIQRAEEGFGCKAEISRYKNQLYVAKLTQDGCETGLLADGDYTNLREIQLKDFCFWTKPGLYGWDKVDEASKLLMDWLSENSESISGKRMLDLGCGYGYLSIRALEMGATEIVATDNCAAAITACEKNLSSLGIQASVIPSNAGAEVDGNFDVVLCNPPFHQGFSTTDRLHEGFINQTRRLLSNQGNAWFVVNQFLNIENIASQMGLSYREALKTKRFKVIQLSKKHR